MQIVITEKLDAELQKTYAGAITSAVAQNIPYFSAELKGFRI